MVIDRLKVNPEIKQRLAESFETALRLADGRALTVDMDTNAEQLFSAKFACPEPGCDYAIAELEPRLFSFNNPMGACPECDGLGMLLSLTPSAWSLIRACRSVLARLKVGTSAIRIRSQ